MYDYFLRTVWLIFFLIVVFEIVKTRFVWKKTIENPPETQMVKKKYKFQNTMKNIC